MSFLELIVLSVGLAMDVTAVAFARGLSSTIVTWRMMATIGFFFGGGHLVMTLVGSFLGDQLGATVAAWAHVIAALTLVGLGLYGFWEAIRGHDDGEPLSLDWRTLLPISLMTSLDTLAVGFSLRLLDARPVFAAVMIGIVAGLFSGAGLWAGHRAGRHFERHLGWLGGTILIAIGLNILLEAW